MVGASALMAAPPRHARAVRLPARAARARPTGTSRSPTGRHGPYRPTAAAVERRRRRRPDTARDRKSTRLNSSHVRISYAVFCLKKKKKTKKHQHYEKKKKKKK